MAVSAIVQSHWLGDCHKAALAYWGIGHLFVDAFHNPIVVRVRGDKHNLRSKTFPN
jgi:hypothetical protein